MRRRMPWTTASSRPDRRGRNKRGSRGPRSDLHLRPAFDLGQQRRPAITSAGNDSPISRLDCLEGIRSSRWRVVNGCSPMSTRHACKRNRRSSGVSGPPIETFRGVVDREATLLLLALTSSTHILCGNHSAVGAQTEELVTLADKKDAVYWKAFGTWMQGWLCAASGKAVEAAQILILGMTAWRSTGATLALGVSRATFDLATNGLEPDLSLPDLVLPGPDRRPSWRLSGRVYFSSPSCSAAPIA